MREGSGLIKACLTTCDPHQVGPVNCGNPNRLSAGYEDSMRIENKLKNMGIILPDFGASTYYGANYGKMRPFHRGKPSDAVGARS
jgi:hypothetical protein